MKKRFSRIYLKLPTNALGKTVNPSCAVVGRSSYFRATVSDNIQDGEITWTASSEAAGLQTQTGPTAEVIPTACGTYSLTIQVGDYERAKGYIQFLAVEETTTEIRAFILGENNTFHITAAEVTNYVLIVNRIYEQVGMKFALHSVTNLNVENSDWLNITEAAKHNGIAAGHYPGTADVRRQLRGGDGDPIRPCPRILARHRRRPRHIPGARGRHTGLQPIFPYRLKGKET